MSAVFDGFKKGEYNIQRRPRLLVKRRFYDFHTLVRTTKPSPTGGFLKIFADKCSNLHVWETRMLEIARQGVAASQAGTLDTGQAMDGQKPA